MRILILDDEPNVRRTLRVALEATGHSVEEAASGPVALGLVGRQVFDVALVDLRLGGELGLDLLAPLLEQSPRLAVVIITAHASIDTAVEAMRRGAFDDLPKPFTPAQVRAVLERVTRVRGLTDRLADLEDRVRSEVPEADLEGRDPEVRRVLDLARRVAASDAVVLIRGESGVGKQAVPGGSGPVELGGPVTLERIELEHVRRILAATGSLDEAARVLGVDPSTLYHERKQFGL